MPQLLTHTIHTEAAGLSRTPERSEWRFVCLLQIVFVLVACLGLNGPAVSTHFARQNQTFDVARHVYQDGWSAVFYPKSSFSQFRSPKDNSPLASPALRYTIIHLEFPFHGLIGWPFAAVLKNHEQAVARLVSVAFAILSIGFCYPVLRHWLPPLESRIGSALWATSPLLMHFGQVVMPDVLATTGMIAAFAFALRGKLAFSSAAFLFALLAKMSVIVFGLPILTALLMAKQCRSLRQFLTLSLAWGVLPLLGAAAWYSLGLHDPPGSWTVIGAYHPGDYGRIHLADLLHPKFYLLPIIFLLPLGCSVIGSLGLLALFRRARSPKSPLVPAILIAIVCNYILGRIAWVESQYSLPVLFWVVVAASFGVGPILNVLQKWKSGKIIIPSVVVLHIACVIMAICFFKTSRVSNVPALQEAASHTPPDTRFVVYTTIVGTSPPVWLERNTLTLSPWFASSPTELKALTGQLKSLKEAGFAYLLVFDLNEPQTGLSTFNRQISGYHPTAFTAPGSPIRAFCDGNYPKVFEGDHVLLYGL